MFGAGVYNLGLGLKSRVAAGEGPVLPGEKTPALQACFRQEQSCRCSRVTDPGQPHQPLPWMSTAPFRTAGVWPLSQTWCQTTSQVPVNRSPQARQTQPLQGGRGGGWLWPPQPRPGAGLIPKSSFKELTCPGFPDTCRCDIPVTAGWSGKGQKAEAPRSPGLLSGLLTQSLVVRICTSVFLVTASAGNCVCPARLHASHS